MSKVMDVILAFSCGQRRVAGRTSASTRVSPFDLGDMSHHGKGIDAADEIGILGRVSGRYVLGHGRSAVLDSIGESSDSLSTQRGDKRENVHVLTMKFHRYIP